MDWLLRVTISFLCVALIATTSAAAQDGKSKGTWRALAVVRRADLMVKAIMIGLCFASLLTWTIFTRGPGREARRFEKELLAHDISILQRHAEQQILFCGDIIAWSAHSRQTKSASGSRPHCFR